MDRTWDVISLDEFLALVARVLPLTKSHRTQNRRRRADRVSTKR